MQDKNSTSYPFGLRLKRWSKDLFGSLKEFATRLEISPQHLSAYISGERKPTFDTFVKLRSLGADLNFLVDGNSTDSVTVDTGDATKIPLAIDAAQMILGISLEIISPQLEATPSQVRQWSAGSAYPSPRQLALLFNLVAIAGVAARCGGHALPAPSPDLPLAATA